MTELKYTPAPWLVQHINITIAKDAKERACYAYNFRILRSEHTSNLQAESDAKLIAAAPDLLEALIKIESMVNKSVSKLESYGVTDWVKVLANAQQAIEKATA